MDSLKVGDRVGVTVKGTDSPRIGTVTRVSDNNILHITPDSGALFIAINGYDEIKPVIKTNGG